MSFKRIEKEVINTVLDFMLKHGKNQWNDISKESINAQLDLIAQGKYFGLLSMTDDEISGVLLTSSPEKFAKYFPGELLPTEAGHISEVVINVAYAGQGLGAGILEEAKKIFKSKSIKMIYAERHEENTGSAKVMAKSGFKVIDTFEDFPRRNTGSKRTCISLVRI